MFCDGVQVTDKTGEKSEEWLLLEQNTLFLVHVRQDENEYRQNLREVMDLRLIVVDSRSVAMILDDIDNQSRHRVKNLESVFELPVCHAFDVAVHTCLRTHTEEE